MFTNHFSKYLIAAICMVAALLSVSFVTKSSTTAADRSYDALEQMRDQRLVPGVVIADRGYDQVEQLRMNRLTKSFAVESIDYDIESLRTQFHRAQPQAAPVVLPQSADRSYDGIENFRAYGHLP